MSEHPLVSTLHALLLSAFRSGATFQEKRVSPETEFEDWYKKSDQHFDEWIEYEKHNQKYQLVATQLKEASFD